jgi:hypothetical protein
MSNINYLRIEYDRFDKSEARSIPLKPCHPLFDKGLKLGILGMETEIIIETIFKFYRGSLMGIITMHRVS